MPQRRYGLIVVLGVLIAASLAFFHGQNTAGHIGGPMSVPKLFWLDYALAACFVLPFYFWRSERVAAPLRRIYGAHLLGFTIRGVIELWMLYVTVTWSPPYGIAHCLADIVLITVLAWRLPPAAEWAEPWDRAARRFLTSLRVGLVCESTFAALFHQVADSRAGIYFASDAPVFAFINTLTAVVVVFAWPNLLATVWAARDALLPPRPLPAEVRHA
jgi:hypothetical protein